LTKKQTPKKMANNIDVNAIKIFGKVIDQDGKKTPTGKKCVLKFKSTAPNGRPTKGELIVGLTFAIESKGFKPEMQWSTLADPEDDALTATSYFVPLKSGPQKITIKFNGKKVGGPQPLVIDAVGPEPDVNAMLSKVWEDS